MKWERSEIAKLIISGSLIIATIIVTSLTVGRDIYYGSRDESLWSFAIISLSGYLFFFLFIPVELPFIYYLNGDVNVWILNLVAIGTALISQSIDYLIGYVFSSKIIDKLIGRHRYEKAEAELRKYGNIAILVFNVLPLSSPIISLAAGMLKHRVKDAIIYTAVGTVIKYLGLTLIFR
jgi:membrane protein DedA with SNARE-associated domain